MGLLDDNSGLADLLRARGLLRPQPGDPMLAEAVNPRLALQRRMAAEGQAQPGLPDAMPQGQRFGKQWTPEEIARQRAALQMLLQQRGGQ